ncbi:MAG: MerR family transcriptional regulator [Desulfobaccales bacterium]
MTKNKEKLTSRKTSSPAGLKMQDLVAATGLAKSTILHYLNKGLLPAPLKTSRNMAYYSPDCVERLTFIKVMQSKYRLSLGMIKQFLQEGKVGPELEPFLELRSVILGRQDEQELLDLEAFCRATGLTAPEVEELQGAGLLLPLEPERFDAEDLAIGRVHKRCRELGITLEEASFYPRLAREIVDHEMAFRDRLIKGLSLEANATLTLELTRGARALRPYVIDRMFQHRVMSRQSIEGEGEK